MDRIAEFQKVSFEQFYQSWKDEFNDDDNKIKEIYEAIKIPRRATSGSAGYDFFAPVSFTLAPDETLKVPTGIRCRIDDGWVLMIYPRSGLGFKFRLQLNNT
ncbi:MAG: deoxyuridine 5'-triphosphate nucleotidohydrolase, partial [Ruminococcus sp.]|nr:deoxyuridine 5'-triphosphate nucleotidohydrolase [Candidatus Copronaster equi]